MLVALSIISIAALTLVRLDAYAVRTAGDLDESTVAGIVAQNRAVELWTDPAPPTIGASTTSVTNAGRNWRIEQRVAPTADDSLLRIDPVSYTHLDVYKRQRKCRASPAPCRRATATSSSTSARSKRR